VEISWRVHPKHHQARAYFHYFASASTHQKSWSQAPTPRAGFVRRQAQWLQSSPLKQHLDQKHL
jgi:hypothetical protein